MRIALALAAFSLGLASCAGTTASTGINVGVHLTCDNREAAQALLDSLAGDRTSAAADKVFGVLRLVCPLLLPTPVQGN